MATKRYKAKLKPSILSHHQLLTGKPAKEVIEKSLSNSFIEPIDPLYEPLLHSLATYFGVRAIWVENITNDVDNPTVLSLVAVGYPSNVHQYLKLCKDLISRLNREATSYRKDWRRQKKRIRQYNRKNLTKKAQLPDLRILTSMHLQKRVRYYTDFVNYLLEKSRKHQNGLFPLDAIDKYIEQNKPRTGKATKTRKHLQLLKG